MNRQMYASVALLGGRFGETSSPFRCLRFLWQNRKDFSDYLDRRTLLDLSTGLSIFSGFCQIRIGRTPLIFYQLRLKRYNWFLGIHGHGFIN